MAYSTNSSKLKGTYKQNPNPVNPGTEVNPLLAKEGHEQPFLEGKFINKTHITQVQKQTSKHHI